MTPRNPLVHVLVFFLLIAGWFGSGAFAQEPFLLGGIQVNEDDHDRWSAALHQAGMNTVQVTVYAHQGPWHGPNLWFEDEEPSVLAEIRAARRGGLRVVLIPRVALDHNEPDNRFLWHGLVYPRSEPELAEWFRRYTAFVVKWARIAAEEDVEVFGVGSEMNSLAATLPVADIPNLPAYYLDEEQQQDLRALVRSQDHRFTEEVRLSMGAGDVVSFGDLLLKRNHAERAWAKIYVFAGEDTPIEAMNRRRRLLTEHWRTLIATVREVYSGKLTFAANFDNYHEVAFWDRLDLIGINAYFPLRKSPSDPLREADLVDSWRGIFGKIDAFRAEHSLRQKVVFTELGYSRYEAVTVAPWTAHGFVRIWNPPVEDGLLIWAEQPIAPDERAMAVRALHTLGSESLAGILYWKLSSRIDLQRYEPFMLDLGLDTEARDPLLDALRLFTRWEAPDCAKISAEEDPILTCARLDQIAVMRELLSSRSPDVSDLKGRTALHLAADQASAEMVELLLEEGARADAGDRHGITPLHVAARRGLGKIVAPLVAGSRGRGDRGKNHPIHYAAYYGKAEAFRLLWSPRAARRKNRDGQSLLHHAAHGGNPEILAMLLKQGLRVNRRDRAGRTPLHEAVEKGHVEAVRMLLAKKARVDPVDKEGVGVLHLAAAGKEARVLPLLLDQDPRLEIPDRDGNTPLHHAAGWGRVENVRRLLAAGASPAARNGEGRTPLQMAEESGRKRVVELLRSELP